VIDCCAHGFVAARSRARIHTVLVDAGEHRRTVGIDDALGPAVGRSTEVVGEAGADWSSALLSTVGVGTTRMWVAGRGGNYWRSF